MYPQPSKTDLVAEWRKQDPFLEDAEGFQEFLNQRLPKIVKEQEEKGKHQWNLFFSMWERPVVYDSLGRVWADTVPQWLKGQIMIERLIQVATGEEGIATDAEVVAYLYTASMASPLTRDWVEIYCFLVIQVMKRADQKRDYAAVEKELNVQPLTEYQKGLLTDLKRSIWDSGMRASAKARGDRKRSMKHL